MATTFTDFLDDCELALNDVSNTTWQRNTLIAWGKEACLDFPILRPREYSLTLLSDARSFSLLPDFREIVSVEFPISQDPPAYLTRFNRRDPEFYTSENYFDIDYDYATGKGWMLWTSAMHYTDDQLNINYLANHATNLADNDTDELTVTDDQVHILVTYVLIKAYRERLSTYMKDPTAYSQIIAQMVASVEAAENFYKYLIDQAIARLTSSKPSPKMKLDNFDRVY